VTDGILIAFGQSLNPLPMALPDIIRYFRDCYEADNRRSAIWNVFHPSVEHRLFVEGKDELLNGFLPFTAIDPERGLAAMKAAYLYRKEKELVYCSLFVVGWLRAREQEPQAICAPLIVHPAEILQEDPHIFLKLDLNHGQINHRLLDCLQGDADERSLAERLAEKLRCGAISWAKVSDAAELLEEALPGLDSSALLHYPELISETELRKSFQAVKNDRTMPLKALPGCLAALVKKSFETRGVIDELSALAESDSFSQPLRLLFGEQQAKTAPVRRVSLGRVPAVLSESQKRILELAATSPLTLVIGPPGTGKSFTIAALAMEHLSRGQSVLIASKMDHAVDVVGNKIEQQLGIKGCVVRGGRKHYLKDLKRYLEQLLSGMHMAQLTENRQLAQLNRELAQLDRELDRLERQLTRRDRQEGVWGRSLATAPAGFLDALKNRYVRWRVARATPLWQWLDQLERLLYERIYKTTLLLQLLNRRRLSDALSRHRPEFTTFLQAIRARTGGKQEVLFQTIDFKTLFTAFPVWLANLADIHDVLPLREELLDLAIIDEATQCDIATCLPILQRARRVVITGDPNQLRHLSFLSRARQAELQEAHGVPPEHACFYDYREKSILDFVNATLTSQDQVVFLNEHYRSAPPIIAFSNETFYGGALRIMTEKPGAQAGCSLTLRYINGQRNAAGENMAEARQLFADASRQIEEERALGPEACHSIGILSPFRGQVDYISQHLAQELSLEAFDKHKILVGTAHTFQGEERDIMYLSLAADVKSHAATLRFLGKADVFNVSVTRARVAQYVYTSLDPARLDPTSLLGAYLRHIHRSQSGQQQQPRLPDHPQDDFLCKVQQELARRGFETWPRYLLAGITLDLVVARDGHSFGIDLVGYPGAHESAFPLDQYKMLHRAGLKIFPLPYSQWCLSKDECLEAIERALGSLLV